jgi:hypothetical protein
LALNLLFSTQAAYAAPLILLSQNRQTETDGVNAEHDCQVNQLALRYLTARDGDAHGADGACIPRCRAIGRRRATCTPHRRDNCGEGRMVRTR